MSDVIKSYSDFSEILAYISRFYHELLLIILESRDHGCQFWKKLISPDFSLNFRKGMITKSQRVSSKALRVMARKLRGPKDPLDRIGLSVEIELSAGTCMATLSLFAFKNRRNEFCRLVPLLGLFDRGTFSELSFSLWLRFRFQLWDFPVSFQGRSQP